MALLTTTKDLVSHLASLVKEASACEEVEAVGTKAKVRVISFSTCQAVVSSITDLLKLVKTVEDASNQGRRRIESAMESISRDLIVLMDPSDSLARPEGLMGAVAGVTEAVREVVAAASSGDQKQVREYWLNCTGW